jgi:hypothetical protein
MCLLECFNKPQLNLSLCCRAKEKPFSYLNLSQVLAHLNTLGSQNLSLQDGKSGRQSVSFPAFWMTGVDGSVASLQRPLVTLLTRLQL